MDDTDKGQISGAINWVNFTIEIPKGEHKVRWEYAKNSSNSQYEDRAYLKNVSVYDAQIVNIRLNGFYGFFNILEGNLFANIAKKGEKIVLSATPNPGCEFYAWTDEAGNILSFDEVYEFTVGDEEINIVCVFFDKSYYDISWFENPGEYRGESKEFPYLIRDKYDFKGLMNLVNGTATGYTQAVDFSGKFIRLENDIDLTDYIWTPIGINDSSKFAGTFDGNNKTIKNVTFDGISEFKGVFGIVCGTIKNLNVEAVVVSEDDNINAGAIAARLENGTISDSSATLIVGITTAGSIGGIAAYSENSSILNSSAVLMIDGSTAFPQGTIGGIVGYSSNSTLEKVSSILGVTKDVQYAGGIVGEAINTKIENAKAEGVIQGASIAGGLIGRASAGQNNVEILNSISSVTLQANTCGGLVGYADGVTILNSHYCGMITGTNGGGFIGENNKPYSKIINSYYSKDNTVNNLVNPVGTGESITLTNSKSILPSAFSSGEIAYYLNNVYNVSGEFVSLTDIWTQGEIYPEYANENPVRKLSIYTRNSVYYRYIKANSLVDISSLGIDGKFASKDVEITDNKFTMPKANVAIYLENLRDINFGSNNENWGFVHALSGDYSNGKVFVGEIVNLNAHPNFSYEFLYWCDTDGNILSYDRDYSFTVIDDINAYAVFQLDRRVDISWYVDFKDTDTGKSEDNPYIIDSVSDIFGLCALVNGYICDENVSGAVSFKNQYIKIANDIVFDHDYEYYDNTLWQIERDFEGNIDGDNHTIYFKTGFSRFSSLNGAKIKNLNYKSDLPLGAGFFNKVSDSEIINCNFESTIYDNDVGAYFRIFGIAGEVEKSKIIDCNVVLNIYWGCYDFGGIAENIEESEIINCKVFANVTKSYVSESGGISCTASDSKILNCYTEINIQGDSSNVSGITNSANNTLISGCSTKIFVFAAGGIYSSGISNIFRNGVIENVTAEVDITLYEKNTPEFLGGISAIISNSEIKNAKVFGKFDTPDYSAGGIAGKAEGDVKISNSEVYCGIIAMYPAGIVSESKGSIIENCLYYGDITTKYNTFFNKPGLGAGLVVHSENDLIKNCFTGGTLTLEENTSGGGLALNLTGTKITNSHFGGKFICLSDNNAAGLVLENNGSVVNSTYVKNDEVNDGISPIYQGNPAPRWENLLPEAVQNGEISYKLNHVYDENDNQIGLSDIWAKGENHPVFAWGNPARKVTIKDFISGEEFYKYENANQTVDLSSYDIPFYRYESHDVEISDNKFIMPASDILLNGFAIRNIDVRPNKEKYGTVTILANVSDGKIEKGETVKLTAQPNRKYNFLYWSDNAGNILSYDKEYEFVVEDDVDILAVFELDPRIDVSWYEDFKDTDTGKSEEKPYIIDSYAGFLGFIALVNGDVYDEKVNGYVSFEDEFIRLSNDLDIYIDELFSSIGNAFKGTFDGDTHTITIKEGASNGLFSRIEGGKIKNLNFKTDVSVAGCFIDEVYGSEIVNCGFETTYGTDYSGNYAYGVADTVNNSKITDCNVILNITGNILGFGGIAHEITSSEIINCTVFAADTNIETSYFCVGISRFTQNSKIINCYTEIYTQGDNVNVSGITYMANNTLISNCQTKLFADSNVSSFITGIAYNFTNGTIENVLADVDIKADTVIEFSGISGMLANVSDSEIKNAKVLGKINAPDYYVGGIAGYAYNAKILNSEVLCDIEALNAGGIVRLSEGTIIENCLYYGNLTCRNKVPLFKKGYAAGLVVISQNDTIKNCFAGGTITLDIESYAGGLVAQLDGGTIINSHFGGEFLNVQDGKVGALVASIANGKVVSSGFVKEGDKNSDISPIYEGDGQLSDCGEFKTLDLTNGKLVYKLNQVYDGETFTPTGEFSDIFAQGENCPVLAKDTDPAVRKVTIKFKDQTFENYVSVGSTFTLEEGFVYTSTDVEIVNRSFTMPKKDVVIEGIEIFTVEISQNDFGTIYTNAGDIDPVMPGIQVLDGTKIKIWAQPKEGYEFAMWWDQDTTIEREIVVLGNLNISAEFIRIIRTITILEPVGGTITVEAQDLDGSRDGIQVYYGTMVTVKAIPDNGYYFSAWWDGNTETERAFTVNGAITLSASFTAIPVYTITVTQTEGGAVFAEAEDLDSALDGIQVYEGTKVKIKAQAQKGYTFSSWWDNATAIEREITVDKDINVSAVFSKNTYTITVSQNTGGTVFVEAEDLDSNLDGIQVYHGTKVTIKAEVETGYNFAAWWDGDTQTEREILVTGDITISATFAAIPVYTIKIEQSEGGTVSVYVQDLDPLVDGIQVYEGTTVRIIAQAEEGYEFSACWDGDTNAEREIEINSDLNIFSQFSKIETDKFLNFTAERDLGMCKVIVAGYKGNKLVNIKIVDLDIKANVENKVYIESFADDLETIKVFIWDGLTSIAPKHAPFVFNLKK